MPTLTTSLSRLIPVCHRVGACSASAQNSWILTTLPPIMPFTVLMMFLCVGHTIIWLGSHSPFQRA